MKNIEPQIIHLPKILDLRGNLTFLQHPDHLPYSIQRAYWIYDVPGGEIRGGHAFKEQNEFIIAISGSFDVVIDQGESEKIYSLNRSYVGLHIPPGKWRTIQNFSTNSLALVLASTKFNAADYIRSYDEYKNFNYNLNNLSTPSYLSEIVSKISINASKSSINDCKIIELDKKHKEKGNITVVENRIEVPFDINRVYYLYDVPGGEERGGHGHKDLYQLIVAAGGSFDVVLNDGVNQKTVTLNRPYQGLYIVPGIWRELNNFSSGSTSLVLASNKYEVEDYIRDYEEFKNFKNTI
ncbi:WxcM-like domain-containing protein [Flavobacterium sp. RSP49]|uniref:sugar 3,4-ketoisomerase n=1 Tax=Flavobacterium sp. RSP49 TaxID=2497487 RepID=UPI000F827074|nr:FdtA/QdtA family cupin domain-containing protein [Flavobacterium sp. RSP49]RTZ00901.1 WxcM-like domain-containing protein [Flavobacterium sp. RSP49]